MDVRNIGNLGAKVFFYLSLVQMSLGVMWLLAPGGEILNFYVHLFVEQFQKTKDAFIKKAFRPFGRN